VNKKKDGENWSFTDGMLYRKFEQWGIQSIERLRTSQVDPPGMYSHVITWGHSVT